MYYTFNVFRGSESGKVIQDQITRPLNSNDVLLEVTHGSLCGTDELYIRSPQVLGHEGAGIVKEVGPRVQSVNVGDRVGVTYIQKTCNKCDNCVHGWDQYCSSRQPYGRGDTNQGAFGSQAIWDADSLIPIPANYGSSDAAAIMCGGATAWSVLTRYGLRPGQRVGVIGVGGMGHLAVKLSAALGYHTVVFSRSDAKKEDCIKFGAREFHVLKQDKFIDASDVSAGSLPDTVQPVHHLLLCSSGTQDYSSLMPLVATNGTIYPLTVTLEATPVPLLVMIDNGIRIQGSLTAPRESIRQLLEFCAKHRIFPTTEKFPLSQTGIQEAIESRRVGDVRYKCILVNEAATV